MKMVNYGDMLYPQYDHKFEKTISKETWNELQKKAEENLKNCREAHPKVIEHWLSIVKGIIPFGYKLED